MIIIDVEDLLVLIGGTITIIVGGLLVHIIGLGEITEAELGAILLVGETTLQGDTNI